MVVEVDGVQSAPRYLSSGVPQGCIPSPLFFLCLSMIFVLVFVFQSFISFFFFYFIIIYYISIVLDCGNADDLQINLSEDRKDLDEMISALRIWLRFLDGRLRMGCYLTPASRRKF
jgi:hypothetical protein